MMPLWKRFVASTLDKIAILIFFALAMFFIQYTPYTAAGRIGRFVGMMSIPPSHYENIDMVSIDRGSATKNTSDYFQKREAYDLSREGIQTCKELDLTITIWFIFINVLYYLIGELIVGASFCKALLGGRLFDYKGNRITALHILLRNILFCLILIIFVALRFGLNISYFITIILFFLLYDSSLFKSKQNLLDKISRCYLRVKSYNQNNVTAINDSNQIESQTTENDLNVNLSCEKNVCQKETRASAITNRKHRIVWLLFVVFTLYSIQNILSYFFADYYNPSNYDITNNAYIEKESDNYLRKVYENGNQSWNEFPTEQFAISRHLSHTNTEGRWGSPKYGPIPNGKLISTYEGSGSDTYYAGYKTVTRFRWEEEVPIDLGYELLKIMPSSYEEMESIRKRFIKKKKVYYTSEEPYFNTYNYRNSISTYAISGLVSIFANYEWLYKSYLNDIAKQLYANHIPFTYIKLDGKTAISYKSKDFGVRRVIVYANGNAYLLETEAIVKQSEQSELLCSSVSLNHFQIIGGKRKIVTIYCVLFLCVFIVITYFSHRICKSEICNRYAYSLFCVGIGSVVVCFAIAMYQSYLLFTNSPSCYSVYILVGTLFTATFISTPLSVFYYQKSKEKWGYEYIVPPLLKRFHYDTIKSEVKKKLYISFICYPLMVLSLLPLGLFVVLLYSIPLLLICTISIWFNKWRNWVKGSKVPEDVSTNNKL